MVLIMERRNRLWWLSLAFVVAVAGCGWWLFGISIWRTGQHTYISRRVLGRVTRIHVLDSTLRERERLLFRLSEPFERGDPVTDCAAIFPERWLDMNGDGIWDTWLTRLGPDVSGHCRVEYRVDTTLDGAPDWTFARNFSAYEEANAAIVARRGF
jgi:hypothetical protein